MKEYLIDWVDYLRSLRQYSSGTIRDMKCSVNLFIKTLKSPEINLDSILPLDIEKWVMHTRNRGMKDSYISKSLCHLRSFFSFLENTGKVKTNPAENIRLVFKASPKVRNYLLRDEIALLLRAFTDKNRIDYRNKTLIMFLYGTGLRTSELINLNRLDIDFERGFVFIKKGKKNRQRYVPLPKSVAERLFEYIEKQRYRKNDPAALFTRRDSRRLTVEMLRDIIKDGCNKCGIEKNVTPKTLRHTYATHLIEEGVSIAVLGKMMGHSTIRETSTYIHVIDERLHSAIRKHPCDQESWGE